MAGKIGFVGLGIMGKPMAKNLLKAGYTVVCYDILQANVDEVCAAGAEKGLSNKDVASRCSVIVTMLPNSPHVKEAVFGENGIAEGAKPGMRNSVSAGRSAVAGRCAAAPISAELPIAQAIAARAR